MNVLIVTYNQEEIIEKTIESVINQSYENITKIIISDDGSNDETPSIIKTYAKKNQLIYPVLAEKNKGITYNMNRALYHANGDYISFLDGDDLMFQNKIEKQVKFLETNPKIVVCAHDMDVFDSRKGKSIGKFSKIINFNSMKGEIGIKSIFDPSLLLSPSSMMYRSNSIPPKGFDNRVKFWSEFIFIVEVLMKGNLGFLTEVLGQYTLHEGNATSSQVMRETGLENALIVYAIILAKYPELHSLIKKRRNATYISNILDSIKNDDRERAKSLSKVLISDGNYFKGLNAYLLSLILNKEKIEKLYTHKKLMKLFIKNI